MRTQLADLSYGDQRERLNHSTIEGHLGVRIRKLDKYHTMDWEEISGDDNPPWWIEQKARNVCWDFCCRNYKYNNIPTALIGKHKIDFIKNHGGNGVIYFDFTDKLMYWVYDEEEYNTFDVEQSFVRNARSDYIDKPSPVVHIPCSILKEVERG